MNWPILIILLGLYILCSCEVKHYGINFNYNNTYKYSEVYVVTINKSTEYIMEFSGDITMFDRPARVTVASELANKTYPVFITTRQQKGVFSWQLPMLVQTQNKVDEFNNVSRTLCPHNNVFIEDIETCDVSNQNTPIIHLTSSSPDDIDVTILVETVDDFYLQLNKTTNVASSPSQPKYYFYPFKQNAHFQIDVESQTIKKKYICNKIIESEESNKLAHYMNKQLGVKGYLQKPKSVIVMIESDDDICAVVSIQNFSCPVFDNERDILYEGFYLTMTRRGGITLTQDSFPLGFYIVFIVKSSDEDCTDQTITNNITLNKMAQFVGWKDTSNIHVTTNDGRLKTFRLKIVETISYQEYIIAAGGALGLFLTFYLAAFIAVMCQTGRKKSAASDSMTVSQSEEGTLTPPDDITTDTTRRRIPNIQDVMDTSYASTSRQNLIENNFVEHEICPNTHTECSSSSDSESEYSTLGDIDREKDVFRLPGRLCLANLARKRPRVLSARSKMYLWNVLTVTVFYTLPVIQLVVTYQRMLNQSGNQDLCYFNFLCAHPLLMLSDFNHVYSNLGYVLLGALFIMQVWRRHRVHLSRTPDEKELGIPQHFGLLYAMGVALVSEGFLSAAYHVCPNSMNFQFDTSFMYVTSVLCMVKIYQSRHPDINARAHATFGVLALIIFIGLVGVLNADVYFWVLFTILHILSCFVMTFQIYYMGRFRFDAGIVGRACKELVSRPLLAITPTYVGRCVLLLLANLANWAIAAYGVIQHNRDFASHLLLILMSNLFLYTMFYIIMKLLHRESIAWYTWVFIALTYSFWFGSSYFFLDLSTNWSVTPAQSRKSNQVCSLLQLYDSHDIWHFLSSIAMFFSFNMYLTMDDNLSEVSRKNIMVF